MEMHVEEIFLRRGCWRKDPSTGDNGSLATWGANGPRQVGHDHSLAPIRGMTIRPGLAQEVLGAS